MIRSEEKKKEEIKSKLLPMMKMMQFQDEKYLYQANIYIYYNTLIIINDLINMCSFLLN